MKLFEDVQNKTLRFYILVTFSVLSCISIACGILYSSYESEALILKFEKEQYTKKSTEIAANWLNSYFKQVGLILSVLAQNSLVENEQKVGNKTSFLDFEDLFREAIENTPFTVAIYIGLADGRYMHITHAKNFKDRLNSGTEQLASYVSYVIKKIERGENGELSESWEYLNDDFNLISKDTLHHITIEPQKRPWYAQTMMNKCITYTDVYMFKTSKTPGITVATPITRSDGEILGVIAVDFTIQEFKKLLTENIKPTEHSTAYLINSKNEIIASTSDEDGFEIKGNGEIALEKVSLTKNEILLGAAKTLLGTNETYAMYNIKSGDGYIATIQNLDDTPFSVMMTIPQSDFTQNLQKIRQRILFVPLMIFLLSVGIIFHLSRKISEPMLQLCKSAEMIGNMDLENFQLPLNSKTLEIHSLSEAMNAIKVSISTFSKYAPKDLVRKLLKNGSRAELGGKMAEVTLFFSHIDDFSTTSEKLPAEYLITHLSEYFDKLTKIIIENNGIIDKYIGDSIMAIWGSPTPDDAQATHSCEVALLCQEVLMQLSKKWLPLGKPLMPTQIGIHTGMAIVGNIGSRERMNFTAIGDTVNIASRLGGANKFYGTDILVSETVELKARNKILFRVIDKIAVKGRNAGITIFEPLCVMQNADEKYYKLIELCSKSKEAFELFQSQNFSDALKVYENIKRLFPEKERSISPLIERCKEFIASPPQNWDGVNHLRAK